MLPEKPAVLNKINKLGQKPDPFLNRFVAPARVSRDLGSQSVRASEPS